MLTGNHRHFRSGCPHGRLLRCSGEAAAGKHLGTRHLLVVQSDLTFRLLELIDQVFLNLAVAVSVIWFHRLVVVYSFQSGFALTHSQFCFADS